MICINDTFWYYFVYLLLMYCNYCDFTLIPFSYGIPGEPVSVIEKQLDSCTVSVYPPLNPDHETVTVPENMLTQFGIVAKVNKDGVVVSGADMIYNYEQVSVKKVIQ
jgi:hypothetical protein